MHNADIKKRKSYFQQNLHKIIKSQFFFVCTYKANDQTKFNIFKKECRSVGIEIQIFKNNLLSHAFLSLGWSVFKPAMFGPVLLGYSKRKIDPTKQNISKLFNIIEKDDSCIFLGGFLNSLLLNNARLKSLLKSEISIQSSVLTLLSIKNKLSSPILFFNTTEARRI